MLSLHALTIGVAFIAAALGFLSGGLVLAGRPVPLGRRRYRSRQDGWSQVLIGVFCLAIAAGAVLSRYAAAILVLTPIGLIALGYALRLQVKSIRRQ
ncbi:MAG TPA: hypothetical protein VMB79_11070 [Jatrophihabitans sp.]|nr:hypothetical protein [Jatrophihabitans sp.]